MESAESSAAYKISYDSVDEDADVPWLTLIQNLSHEQLKTLEVKFKENNDFTDEGEVGLNKEQFLDVICEIYENHNYSIQSLILFDSISKGDKFRITWNDFLDYLIENLQPPDQEKVKLTLTGIDPSPQTKRDTIVKIVLIETKKYFCYVLLSKYGKIGLYDGELNYITSYHVIMTREDISRREKDRRRRNRWITDALYCSDVQMFIVTNSARSIIVYEASGLTHTPIWLILSTPHIVQCMAYKYYEPHDPLKSKSILFLGGINGELLTFEFQQPKNGFLRRKYNDKLSLFYWAELPNETDFLIIKSKGKIHKDTIKQIQYYMDNNTVITCSRDPNASLIIAFNEIKRKPYCFKMRLGASTFSLSRKLKVLITGSDDGTIRLWNPVITSKPVSVLTQHKTGIADLQILENQSVLLSCSRDAILHVWDITRNKCIQTIHIPFPSFEVDGTTIEWGLRCIYPGPKRKSPEDNLSDVDIDYSNFDFDDAERKLLSKSEEEKTESKISSLWERSYIIVICCHYIAKIFLTFQDTEINRTFVWTVLPPPPLQNSVLIPLDWALQEDLTERSSSDAEITAFQLDHLNFITNKDLLENKHEDINYRIACLEKKKLEMQRFVSEGAPYLALNLYDIKEIKIPDHLVLPTKKKTLDLIEKTKQLLIDSSLKDKIFSEMSSTRSKSSKSSIVDFPL